MKARLGFAVATIVNPDIMIVDEVLEVGDMRFRRGVMSGCSRCCQAVLRSCLFHIILTQ